ncbi:retrovirus-related Pol polyprotein from transposon 297 [Trichonephila clavata]|uniref:Retrovirus-related Pol polyprotein from transposon 297 n=1 Tax=Trichonephila clavata TaxID=2740835 RepID=A0A8X6LF64_TRICU|nr:retrovirus-related Pol polyprotein from transposon 297 [Trichonephila clavata]
MVRQVTIRQGGLRNTNESQNLTDGMTLCLANAYFFLKGTTKWYPLKTYVTHCEGGSSKDVSTRAAEYPAGITIPRGSHKRRSAASTVIPSRSVAVSRRNEPPRRPRTYATVVHQPRRPVELLPVPRQTDVWRTDDNRPVCFYCGRPGHVPKGTCTLQIRISGQILPFEFIVLPDCSQDIIFGWNFLKNLGARIDCGRFELTLDDVEVTSEEVVLKPLHLCGMKDCRLPAYSIMKIPVVNHCTEDSGNIIVKGSKLLALKKEVFMPSMLVTLRRGKTEIWVVNGKSQEKVLSQGMCVAFAKPFCPDCIATISETSRVPTEIFETKQSFELLKMISPDLDANQKRMLVDMLQEHLKRGKMGLPKLP